VTPLSEVLTAAIADLSATGYVSPERVADWVTRIRNAAESELGPDHDVDAKVRDSLTRLFQSFEGGERMARMVPGVGRFTKEMVKPKLYAELDRRIVAAADLIKVNKAEAVNRTLRRFTGWATSIPPGGDETIDKRETRGMLGKELRDYKYHRRFVDNDQGHKLIANVSALVAEEAGAIAAIWHSHGATDHAYDARRSHLARDGKIYLVRGSWADKQGLLNPVHGYTDEITTVGQEPNCRCWYQYVLSPRRLPDEFLTRKGQEWIEKGRAA
jgi:hypothetical protein